MKLVVNTNYDKESAGGRVLKTLCDRLSLLGHTVKSNDWNNYSSYDIAIFMAPDSKVKETKKNNPKLICGIFDPKLTLSRQIEESKIADFLIVSSIEQREAFLKYNKNIFIYYMFPETPDMPKVHIKKDKIIIGYHGNKQHLDAMKDVSVSLDKLAKIYDIELRVIYNIKKLGRWRINVPKVCPVMHIQWSEETFVNDLSLCDIGIVPSVLPAHRFFAKTFISLFYNPQGYSQNDYVLRFKMSNNPSRIYIFSQLDIPVVTDFTPSACEIIKSNESGFLVGGPNGWYESIEKLVRDHNLRNEISLSLKKNIQNNFSISKNLDNFLTFLKHCEFSK